MDIFQLAQVVISKWHTIDQNCARQVFGRRKRGEEVAMILCEIIVGGLLLPFKLYFQPGRTFKESDQFWLGVDSRLARKPILERGARQTTLLRKLSLGSSLTGSRFKLDDFRRNSGTRQSRLFCLLLARGRIRLKHGFGSGGAVSVITTTLPEPTMLVESKSAILLMAVGRPRRQHLISKNG